MKKWTPQEMEILKKTYENVSNEDLSKILNRSIDNIKTKARNLGFHKSKSHISKMISKRNKMITRDLSYETLKNIALKYKTRGQFQREDASAYGSARTMNILDDICSHMIAQSYSIPQLVLKNILFQLIESDMLYNTRKVIKPYELDIYFPEYKLAFEYDGKGWHQQDVVDKKEVCEKKNITLITIRENNRIYEEDIKSQLIDNLDVINLKLGLQITALDIKHIHISSTIFDNILDTKTIQEICNNYSSYYKFKIENVNLYSKLLKLKRLNEFTGHMDKTNHNIIWTIGTMKKEVSKYVYLKDFIEKSQGCYLRILKEEKLKYLLDPLIKGSSLKWSEQLIELEISKYKTFQEFYKNSRNCYNSLSERKLLHLLKNRFT